MLNFRQARALTPKISCEDEEHSKQRKLKALCSELRSANRAAKVKVLAAKIRESFRIDRAHHGCCELASFKARVRLLPVRRVLAKTKTAICRHVESSQSALMIV